MAATTLVIGAAYTLWLVKRVIFGSVANEAVAAMRDVNVREFIVLGLVAVGVIGLGVWPRPLVDVLSASVDNLASHITQSKL